jgi:hypothetical protein
MEARKSTGTGVGRYPASVMDQPAAGPVRLQGPHAGHRTGSGALTAAVPTKLPLPRQRAVATVMGRHAPNSLQMQNGRALRDGRCGGASIAGVLTDPIPR